MKGDPRQRIEKLRKQYLAENAHPSTRLHIDRGSGKAYILTGRWAVPAMMNIVECRSEERGLLRAIRTIRRMKATA